MMTVAYHVLQAGDLDEVDIDSLDVEDNPDDDESVHEADDADA